MDSEQLRYLMQLQSFLHVSLCGGGVLLPYLCTCTTVRTAWTESTPWDIDTSKYLSYIYGKAIKLDDNEGAIGM